MIAINLLPGQQRRRGRRIRFGAPDLSRFTTGVKDARLAFAIAVWVLVLLFVGFTLYQQQLRINGLEREREVAQSEYRRYRAIVAQKRAEERIRDSIVTELNVIRQIDGDRYVWPHLLDQITRSLPAFTWLTGITDVTVPSDTFDTTARVVRATISGQTMDVQAYTTFIRNLASSPWLADVVGNNFTQTLEEGRPVTTFSITAQFREPDSAFIRTVPVIESVR